MTQGTHWSYITSDFAAKTVGVRLENETYDYILSTEEASTLQLDHHIVPPLKLPSGDSMHCGIHFCSW